MKLRSQDWWERFYQIREEYPYMTSRSIRLKLSEQDAQLAEELEDYYDNDFEKMKRGEEEFVGLTLKCPDCKTVLGHLGRLGRNEHYQCDGCGYEHSHPSNIFEDDDV